jgi:hypothetical protein
MSIFIIAGVISFIFLLAKFAEMRIMEKESKPLKVLISDALVVYGCVLVGYFVIEQLKPVIADGGASIITPKNPTVFVGDPNF